MPSKIKQFMPGDLIRTRICSAVWSSEGDAVGHVFEDELLIVLLIKNFDLFVTDGRCTGWIGKHVVNKLYHGENLS
jgi:hypothetical protein